MILKKIKLITHHTSWWKRKKYRKEAYETLRNYKSKGWKVKKVVKLKKNKNSIDTRTFKIYLISKQLLGLYIKKSKLIFAKIDMIKFFF